MKGVIFIKNPNKYGTVTKLSGNRRRPFIVKEGLSGKQKIIGYASSRQEGLLILAEYNQNPYNTDSQKTTLQELYALWLDKKAPKLGRSNRNKLKSAYKYCQDLASIPFSQIKAYHMQDCVDKGSAHMQSCIRNLWKYLDKYALELDIVTKNYSSILSTASIPESNRKVFTDEEVDILWSNLHLPWVDSILFLLYTGFRISEMLGLKLENINLEEQTMQGGVKTAAGKNRIVPIHSKIRPIVEARYRTSTDGYLFEVPAPNFKAQKYREYWHTIMNRLHMKHVPHECRHTFRTRLDNAGANKVCIDRLMGHKNGDIGERVYTHKTIKDLRLNLELITN